jgi:hypothetical protein
MFWSGHVANIIVKFVLIFAFETDQEILGAVLAIGDFA